MDRIHEIVLKGQVIALEAAQLAGSLDAATIRSEAARLLAQAGSDITLDLRKRLELLLIAASGGGGPA